MVQESKCFEREGSGRLNIENKTSSLEFFECHIFFVTHYFKMVFKTVFCPRDIASIFFQMKNPSNAYRKGYLI